MNIIIFGLLLSVIVVYGSEESCQESRQLESTCVTYCHKALKPVLEHTKALERQLTDCKPEEKCLSENKFDSQDNTIQQKLRDLSTASEQIMQQIKLQGKQVEQQMEVVKKIIPGPPYQQIGSKYYYIEESEEVNWFEAVNKCLAMDGHLVSFENQDEFNAIKKKLQADKDYWIDINDLANEGEFISVATGKKPTYVNWHYGEPNNGWNFTEHCGDLWFCNGNHLMNDAICQDKQLFICEHRTKLT
ncbi:tetranectin-like protein [Drosophila albomicans]|uniref:Tetranectin-like protein n=1 Tax=Drosophila albomicans TaxID=7291 RepID=A0A6P8W9A9_DROAB|nr:tetranectin-like protein [Drosophila albomicans]